MSRTNETALSALRVLDLTSNRAGAYCTKLLAGFGAEVIKIEPPGGDPMRRLPPFCGEEGPERSIPFLWLNTGKKSVVLDLADSAGREALDGWLRSVDVVVETLPAPVREELGVSWESLSRHHPGLVLTSVSSFGRRGPYAGYQAEEIALYAMSGSMKLTGDPAREPLACGPSVASYTAGMWAYLLTLTALHEVEVTGRGREIDLSIHESAIDNVEIALAEYLHGGSVPNRRNDRHAMVPWELYPCQDGHLAVIGGPPRHWRSAVSLFEAPSMLEPHLMNPISRVQHRKEFEALMAPWLRNRKAAETFHSGQARRLAFGYLASLGDVQSSLQHEARGFFEKVEHPVAGAQLYCGAPFKLTATPWRTERSPLLGEHTHRIPPRPAAGGSLRGAAGKAADGAHLLDGLSILDLTHYWAGPHATRILADLGADVIRVENVGRLCVLRGGYVENERYNQFPRWHQVNRNKLAMTLDLRAARDREIFVDLVRKADLVVENSRGAVMAALGFDYNGLAAINPDVILLSMAAFGGTGPWSGYAGVGGSLEPTSGLQQLTAYPGQEKSMRVKEADVTSGIMGAAAALTALHHRRRTGEGQWIDLSQVEVLDHALIGEHLLEYTATGDQTLPLGNRHPACAPQGCYRCQGEDRWLVLTIRSDAEWARLCEVIGCPKWAVDPAFAGPARRRERHAEIDEAIERYTRERTHSGAMAELQAHGIAAGAVLDLAELAADPHLAARGFFVPGPDGNGPRYAGLPAPVIAPGRLVRRRGADLGQDNHEIVALRLGRPEGDIPRVDPARIRTGYEVD